MRSQPISVASAFFGADWDLLVRLPGQVVVAATSVKADSPNLTVAEGLAGIDAIAAGRSSANSLVRAVVAAIYMERPDDGAVVEEFEDRPAGLNLVFISCRTAAAALKARTGAADRVAYREWITDIATRVCAAPRSGGVFGIGDVWISPAEQRFLDDLAAAFRPAEPFGG